jgi:hypothetical protein
MKASVIFALFLAIFSTGMVEAKLGGLSESSVRGHEPKQRRLVDIEIIGADPVDNYPLARCQGDCDNDVQCVGELVCYQRNAYDPVPGCSGGTSGTSRTDYCVDPSDIPSGPKPPPVASPTSPVVTPTPSPLTNFRLKLYWEEGYDWQEEEFEREWCMKCRNDGCDLGDKIYVYECSEISQTFDFVYVNSVEVLIKLYGTELCLERNNKDIFIKTCNEDNSKHKWFAKVGAFRQNRFEISQKKFTRFCITQRHHPKEGEEVEIESCKQARKGLTSFWNRY